MSNIKDDTDHMDDPNPLIFNVLAVILTILGIWKFIELIGLAYRSYLVPEILQHLH